jgi:D-alanyl-D-alanine-carboxypeptidase/D-alanyl-D-alanine-endopeptidase
MRNKIIIFAAGPILLIAGIFGFFLTNSTEPLQSLYKDFRGRVEDNQERSLQLRWQKQSAVPSVQEITRIVAPLAGKSPGAVVVGLVDRNRQVVLGWGKDVSGHPAGGETIFETASISKAFAGLLLAQMVQEGKVQLEEPVQDLTAVHMPSLGDKPMTLRQLATHSSGLPPWPDNRGDTTAPYSTHDLVSYLGQASLMGQPDSGVMYSNTAFALLGDLLAQKEGTTFDRLLQKRICTPLGMTHTQVGLSEADASRLAIGHWQDGSIAHPSAPTSGGGADGIRSTVHDLLHFLSAYIGVQPTDFGPAMEMTARSYLPYNKELDSGLGWFLDTTDNTIEKAGHIAGYRTSIQYSPDHKCAVVVLAGWEAFPSPEVGKKLLNVMMHRRELIESGAILE